MEQEETPSPQLSGIRALPSHDDDVDVDDDDDDDGDNSDSDPLSETNNSPDKPSENNENNKNSTTVSGSKGSDASINGSSGILPSDNNNSGFESGEDEFETPLAGPDEETLEKTLLVGQSNASGSGTPVGSPAVSAQKLDMPRAKVSTVDDDVNDDDENVVGENVNGIGANEEPDVVDDAGVASGVENNPLESKNDENASSDMSVVEGGDVESSHEKNADGGEAERSGVDVDQVEEKEVIEVKSTEESSIDDSNEMDSETNKKDSVQSVSAGGSVEDPTDGDAVGGKTEERKEFVEDSVPVDIGEVEERKDSGNTEKKSVEKSIPLMEDSVEKPASVDSKASRDGNHVDDVEDIRSEVKGTDKKVKGLSTSVEDHSDSITKSDVDSAGGEQKLETVNKEAEIALSLWENDSSSQEHEFADEVQVVSGEEEKRQLDDVDDKPQASGELDGAASKTTSPEIGVGAKEEINNIRQEEGDVRRSFDHPERADRQIVTESSEEEGDSDEEGEGNELFDSAALNALLKAAAGAGSDSGAITITSQDGSRLFSVERPAGLGPSSLQSVRPGARPSNTSSLAPPRLAGVSDENLSEEQRKKLELVHQLRVKFLRFVYRVGQRAEDSVAAQVLYRLALFPGRTSPASTVDDAKQTAMRLENEGKDDLNFSLNILVLGKTGVGKSATINSIFGEQKVKIGAFEPETTHVHEMSGVVNGVKIRVIDAPGLKCSGLEQGFNRKVLASVKKFMKKYPPDVLIYVDRLDSQSRDLNDVPMLKTITGSLGSSIWRSAIVTLTHASCAPPDGFSYEVFVAQGSRIVQHSIGQAVGDFRLMNPSLMNPVALVENHPACRKNREGQRVLPNGQAWKPQLLLLCYSLKILSEASSILKPQDPFDHRKLFGFRARSSPLPYLLTCLLQARAHPKLPADQGGDSVDSDIDLGVLSDSDQEEEDEYDQLPPFKPLRKSQMAKLTKEQRKAYFEEYDYRVKLLQRKQWREELKRMREMKKKGKIGGDNYSEMLEDFEAENAPAAVQVPLPDMVLPPSFDGDYPAYRYRFLEPTSQFLARPVLDTHGWDHDCGYDGVNVEQSLGITGRYPAAITVQVTKDKKEFNIHMDSALSAKHGENGSSVVGFDIQTIGKQFAYIVRGESKFKSLKKNKAAGGVTLTFLGESMATGVKVEDQITLSNRLVLVGSTGTVRSQKDAAYGANLEVRLREPDYPIGQDQSSLVLSLMKWRGDLAVGAHLQSQFSVGRSSKMAVRFSLNNKLTGQLSVRTSSSDHLQLALAGLIPFVVSIYRKLIPGVSENYSVY